MKLELDYLEHFSSFFDSVFVYIKHLLWILKPIFSHFGTLYCFVELYVILIFKIFRRRQLTSRNPIYKSTEGAITEYIDRSVESVSFNQLDIQGRSRLRFRLKKDSNNKILIDKLIGDGKGEIGALANQTLMIEVTEAKERLIKLTANVFVDFNAGLVMATNLTIDGSSLIVNGILANVRTLIVESKSSIFFGPKSQTGILEGNNFIGLSEYGVQQFGEITLKSSSVYDGKGALKINAGRLLIRTGVSLHRSEANLQVDWIRIERGSIISTNGLGESEKTLHGAGSSGSGGGHASEGGGANGGKAYDSLYNPIMPGSFGGNTSSLGIGGRGGGIIRITASTLLLEGSLECNGADAGVTGGAGGGSGGSLNIVISRVFNGGGKLISNGGKGDGVGGGGSGGRIAVHVSTKNLFYGTINAMGGASSPSGLTGGPGTVYLSDIRDKKKYEILKITNIDLSVDKFVVLNESKMEYQFDEIHLYKKGALMMNDVGKSTDLRVLKIFGDNTGIIHIQSKQSLYFNHHLYRKTTARVNYNLKLDHGGSAYLADTTYFQGTGSIALEVNGTLIGIQYLSIAERRIVKIHPSASTSRKVRGTYISSPEGSYHFASVELFTGSDVRLEGGVGVEFVTSRLNMKYGAKLSAKFFRIKTSTIDVESGSIIDCSGTVFEKRTNVGSNQGGGHGSYGGNGRYSLATPYGSYVKPQSTGSMGGYGTKGGGAGGGYIDVEAGLEVIVDGTITANGKDAPSSSSGGGGSGGSILINGFEVKGTGLLTVNGGKGDSVGGGGSGGRIAVHTPTKNMFTGTYSAIGGAGGTSQSFGGPGTVYIVEIKDKRSHNQLRIDNAKRLSIHPVILDEFNVTNYELNETYILGGAKLQIRPGVGSLRIFTVKGDRSGSLWLLSNHTFFIESEQYSTTAPVNFVVGEYSRLVLPSVVRLIGGFTLISPGPQASLVLRGLLDGVRDMVVTKRKRFFFIGNAHTAFTENGTYTIEAPQTFRFPLFELQDGSQFQLMNVTSMKCTIGNFHLKYGVTLVSDVVDISASNLKLEDGSKITAAGSNRPGLVPDPVLPLGCIGAGGSHAARGGIGDTVSQFVKPHGSLFRPRHFGTRGCPGYVSGGLGGGSIRILVTNKLYVDGVITADGANAASASESGGGAGGSVLINAETFEGHGTLSVVGGNGNAARGGGGSGGRIGVHLKKKVQYLGTFASAGGKSGDATRDKTDKGGGPGTVYIADVRKGYDHTQLRIDNANRGWSYYVTLDENATSYEFSEVHLHRSASLHIIEDSVQRNLTIHKVVGDRTGFLHVHKNQVLTSESRDARRTTSRTLANFKIDEGAEAIMPTVMHIVGLGSVAFDWNGRLTNVLYFHIAHKRKVLIGPMSHTSLIINKERLYVDSFGTFRMSVLEFGSGSVIAYPPPMGVRFTVGLLVSYFFI